MVGTTVISGMIFLSLLDTTDVELKEDTKDLCYLYYKNCVLEISKDSVKIDYIDINGYVEASNY